MNTRELAVSAIRQEYLETHKAYIDSRCSAQKELKRIETSPSLAEKYIPGLKRARQTGYSQDIQEANKADKYFWYYQGAISNLDTLEIIRRSEVHDRERVPVIDLLGEIDGVSVSITVSDTKNTKLLNATIGGRNMHDLEEREAKEVRGDAEGIFDLMYPLVELRNARERVVRVHRPQYS